MNMNASLHRDGRLTFALLLTVSALLLIFNQAAIAAVKKPVLVKLTPLQIFCAANAQARVTDPEMPAPLKCTPAPEPYMLDSSGKKVSLASSIIKNNTVAIALGKMWFWESQSGSDGLACASCHFQAGADNRTKNQINSGFRNATSKTASDNKTAIGNLFDFMASDPNISKLDPLHPAKGKGPNYTLKKTDFPLRQYQEPDAPADGQPLQADRHAKIIYDSDDVISSQGAFHSTFKGLTPTAQEKCTATFPESGPFNVGGQSVRQVEPRNTPTVINAVYNFRNFWDGRANNVFNGLDPFGLRRFANPALTPAGEIYKKDAKGKLVKTRVAIYDASLASQALGPPLSDMEMSCAGKKFPDLARKMLALKPLGKQKVDITDSV